MKRMLEIGHNDLKLFLRSKLGYIWLFLVPLGFTYFTGVGFRGPGSPANPRPSVLIDNLDQGFLGGLLMEELGAQGMNLVGESKRDEAQRGIRIPADFTQKVLSQEETKVEFFQLEGSSDQSASMIELRLLRAMVAINSHLFELASSAAGTNAIADQPLRELMKQPGLVNLKSEFAGRNPIPSGFSHSLPANLVLFLMMNLLIFGGSSVAGERTSGVLRRMAAYPVRRWELVIGKVYGRFLLGGVLIAVFLVMGQLVFGVNLGGNLAGILLTLSIYAWLAASLGVWIGAVMKNEDRVIGLCVLASLVMAALGGCWWPIEIVPDAMKVVAQLVPTGWAMEALHRLISFGGGLGDVVFPLALLSTGAFVANFGAARTLRY